MSFWSHLKPPRWARKLQPGKIAEPLIRAAGYGHAVDQYNQLEAASKGQAPKGAGGFLGFTGLISETVAKIKAQARATGRPPAQIAAEQGADAIAALAAYERNKNLLIGLAVVGGVLIVVWVARKRG